MPSFQFPKPSHWYENTQYITGTVDGRDDTKTIEWGYYTDYSDAIGYLKDEGSYPEVEACLWKVIRVPDEPPRLKFLSYIPSIHTTWDS